MVGYLAEVAVPALVVMNKMDKLSRSERRKALDRAAETLDVDETQLLAFSSKTGEGRDELLQAIESLIDTEAEVAADGDRGA